MNYVKVTTSTTAGRRLLDSGYYLFDLCEIDGEVVVRRICGFEDGRLIKVSLESAGIPREPYGVRESLPDFSWNDSEYNTLTVEKLSKDEFEDMWSRAQLAELEQF